MQNKCLKMFFGAILFALGSNIFTTQIIVENNKFQELWLSPNYIAGKNYSEIPLITKGQAVGSQSSLTLGNAIQSTFFQQKLVSLNITITITNSIPNIVVTLLGSNNTTLAQCSYQDSSHKASTLQAVAVSVKTQPQSSDQIEWLQIEQTSNNSWQANIQFITNDFEEQIINALDLFSAVYDSAVYPSVINALDLFSTVYALNRLPYSDKTFTELQGIIKVNAAKILAQDGDFDVKGWWASNQPDFEAHVGKGFKFSISQINPNSGYAFIQDPWNNYTEASFADKKGVAGLQYGGTAYQSLLANMNSGLNPELTLVILGFDENKKYIADIITTPPTYFGLYAYDTQGKLLEGYPINFDPKSYVGEGGYNVQNGAKGPAQFYFDGLGAIGDLPTLTYPFALTIQWVETYSTLATLWNVLSGSTFKQLWVSPEIISGKDFVEIPLIFNNQGQQSLGIAMKQNLGKNDIVLKVKVASDATQHYALIKGYVWDSTSILKGFRSIADAVIYSWPLKTDKGSSLPLNNMTYGIKGEQVGINLVVETNTTTITQPYSSYSNGEFLINFKVKTGGESTGRQPWRKGGEGIPGRSSHWGK